MFIRQLFIRALLSSKSLHLLQTTSEYMNRTIHWMQEWKSPNLSFTGNSKFDMVISFEKQTHCQFPFLTRRVPGCLAWKRKKNKSRALRDANTMKTFPQHILFLYAACEHWGLFQEIPFCLFTLILNMLAEKQRNSAHHTHHLFLLSYRELAVSANTDKTY